MGMQLYGQAVPMLQQWIKENPSDLDALNALATAFSGQKRYGEAASTLESAIAVAPDRAYLYAQLGYAYMNAEDDDKAIPALKKAVELEPRMYNDVAYSVADANKYLPLALEFAQKAVRNEEEASASVKLDDLKVEDLQHTALIAAYWDTLGWVYFRMGNLDQAEKYLNAAWVLSQDGIVGDHLGQVYEQQHRKEDALHMYRLALSASPGTAGLADFMKKEHGRIERLGGSADAPLFKEADELRALSVIRLPRLVPGTASAEFFVLFAADSRPPGFKIESIKFISGSEKMKSVSGALTPTTFHLTFPDQGPTHVVRRGILGCFQITGCSFVLLNPRDVRSVN